MPEMPEVESARRSFADRIAGAHVLALRLGKPLRWPLQTPPERFAGQRVGAVTRRGKYLWLAFDPPEDGGLLLHLGMSGSLNFAPAVQAAMPPGPWDHFDLHTNRGLLRLTDPRRFGAVVWSADPHLGAAGRLLAGLGVEPLDSGFTAALLHDGLRRRRVAIKQALLAGDIVVGVGNIYASEALFLAGIDPRTRSLRVSLARCQRLVDAVRQVLARAVMLGGSTLRDFRDAHGVGGAFQLEARVYGREGQPCVQCGQPVRRIVQGQRSTYFCPHCQRR
jgi:formamidopyrimidine-DNA glycosylase